MPNAPGWMGLLATVGLRFEALCTDRVSLTVYITPKPSDFPPDSPAQIQERMREQVIGGGTLPAGSIYLDHSWYHLFANPFGTTPGFCQAQHSYRDVLAKASQEAWSILPADIRRTAFGANGFQGWMVIVFRVLAGCGTGSVKWGTKLSLIEGDFARASALAVRGLVQCGREAIVSAMPEDIAGLSDWLAIRAGWFQTWFNNQGEPGVFNLPYIHELNDLFGLSHSEPLGVLRWWCSRQQPRYVRYLITTSHELLCKWAVEGCPDWSDEPLDGSWLLRANNHLSDLLAFFRLHREQGGHSHRPRARRPKRGVTRDKKLEERDKWIYHQCCKRVEHDAIARKLKQMAVKKGWSIVSTKQRIQQIGNEYADRHELKRPPPRQER